MIHSPTNPRGLRHKPRHNFEYGELQTIKKIGSSGRTRTYNPPVNSRMLYQLSY